MVKDGSVVVSEMCWNALQCVVCKHGFGPHVHMCLYVWFICSHGSALLSCFPSVMQTCVHVHLQHVVYICEPMALYTKLYRLNP